MGQKVNPTGFRLGITTDHRSKWFADSNKPGQRYADFVREDIQIRRMIEKTLDRAGISRVNIERRAARAPESSSDAAAPRRTASAPTSRS